MTPIKEIIDNLEIYGKPFLLEAIRAQYTHVSHTQTGRAMPTAESPCNSLKNVIGLPDIKQAIFHNDGRLTLITKQNHYFTFLNILT